MTVTWLVVLRPSHDQVKEKQIQTRGNFPEKNKVEKEISAKQEKFKQTKDRQYLLRFDQKTTNKTKLYKISLANLLISSDNPFHNILRLSDVLPNFLETMGDYYL